MGLFNLFGSESTTEHKETTTTVGSTAQQEGTGLGTISGLDNTQNISGRDSRRAGENVANVGDHASVAGSLSYGDYEIEAGDNAVINLSPPTGLEDAIQSLSRGISVATGQDKATTVPRAQAETSTIYREVILAAVGALVVVLISRR